MYANMLVTKVNLDHTMNPKLRYSFWTNLLVFNSLVTIDTYLLFPLENKHEFEQRNK